MVMPTVLNHGFHRWCVLHGHLFISLLLLSSEYYYTGKGLDLKIESQSSIESVLRNDYETSIFHHLKKSSSLSSWNNSVSCEVLKGVGSLNTTCLLSSNLHFEDDLDIYGTGNLEILPHVSIVCPIKGCFLTFNLSGNVTLGQHASLIAGSIVVYARSLNLDHHSSMNTTALGGPPPAQTSGTPIGHDGAGGGHGGRGASCRKKNKTSLWGGDAYGWSTLSEPWSYGSRGASASADKRFGGNGGGRVMLKVKDILYVDGIVSAEGGEEGDRGGGGSGGSIIINALKL